MKIPETLSGPGEISQSIEDSRRLLDVQDLSKVFPIRHGVFSGQIGEVKALGGVSFTIGRGETLGLVGESGCGKTTTGRLILRLMEPTGGSVRFEGEDVFALSKKEMRACRRRMQVIFQDPYSSLNPRMRVGEILSEPFKIHDTIDRREIPDRVAGLLRLVGLSEAHSRRYPHEFSGGQRQRIGIARAICLNPSLVVADEPVSALDVSVQAQIINLLQDLQEQFGLAYLFIAHDLSVVEHISDRVAVMYLGKIVEIAGSERLYGDPQHPYTRALLSAVPVPDPERRPSRTILEGDVPSPAAVPTGCAFHPRCPERVEECRSLKPELKRFAEGHSVSCIRR